jgi:hypothetical protein
MINFPHMKLALCALDDDDNIIAKTDDFYCEWDSDMEIALRDFGMDIHSEIGQIMVKELKRQLTPSVVVNLLTKIKENQDAG